jgi:hypothetical protein
MGIGKKVTNEYYSCERTRKNVALEKQLPKYKNPLNSSQAEKLENMRRVEKMVFRLKYFSIFLEKLLFL